MRNFVNRLEDVQGIRRVEDKKTKTMGDRETLTEWDSNDGGAKHGQGDRVGGDHGGGGQNHGQLLHVLLHHPLWPDQLGQPVHLTLRQLVVHTKFG